MANHLRRQIRDAAATALTGLATTGSHVFPSRTQPIRDGELPALRIYTGDDSADIEAMGDPNRIIERTTILTVEACVKENDTFDDTVDQILKEVEIAIAANQSLGGAKYVQLKTVSVEQSGEGEKDVGVATMSFEVLYYHALNAPDVAL